MESRFAEILSAFVCFCQTKIRLSSSVTLTLGGFDIKYWMNVWKCTLHSMISKVDDS